MWLEEKGSVLMNYFSHNIKLLRKWYKLTLKDFEKIVKKSYRTISRWEAGLYDPADEDIHLICEHFGLTTIVYISKYLGHSSTKETLDTYAHFFPNESDVVAGIIDRIL